MADARNAATEGAFERDETYITDRIVADLPAGSEPVGERVGQMRWPVEPGRYRLVAARACPWAHRSLIVRRLLGLEDVISLGLVSPTHGEESWRFDLDPDGRDPVLGIHLLREAYEARVPGYPRGITVPAIVDVPSGTVATNDFPQITLDLSTQWREHHRDGAPDLWPEDLRDEMEPVMRRIYTEVNNGVYRCGFAADQEAYDAAYDRLWTALDWLEERLADRRYLMGEHLTEADVRLYTTLVRFDPVYHGHFKCNRHKLSELPVLHAYLRDLFQTPGFGDTTDFAQIKAHYYWVHSDVNPTRVIPQGPDLRGLLEPSGRERLGGSPWGRGTAPGPVREGERVPADHTPLGAATSTAGTPS